jgi:PAS domain S-box-containing protein
MPETAIDPRRLAGLLRSAASIAYSTDGIEAGLRAGLDLVCAYAGWPLGHVYLRDADGDVLTPTDVWHNDDPDRFERFVELTRQTSMPSGVGLPGRILATGAPAWIMDVQDDPNFLRGTAATEVGIRAAFGFPIISSRGVEGILEFFARPAVVPNEPLLELLSQIGLQIGHLLDRAGAQHSLETSEAQLAEAQRLARMGSWHYRVDTDTLTWSTELYRIYQLDPSLSPATFDDYLARVHPDDLEYVRASVLHTIETREPFEHEYRLLFPPDVVRWAHARGEAVKASGAQGSVELAGFCHDITERKRGQEAVRDSESRLAEAQRLAHMGSFNWDARNNIVKWSDELYRIYGLEPGASPATFDAYIAHVHPRDRERVQQAVGRTVETMEPFEHDYRVVRPNGEVRWVHARGEVIEQYNGRAARLSGYCQDITERRAIDEQLRAAAEQERFVAEREKQVLEDLRQIEQTKSAILMGVSHEIRTPLTFMVGVASLLQQPDALSANNIAELLDRLMVNARRLEDSMADLLDVDRLARGIVEPRPRPTPMMEIVERVLVGLGAEGRVQTDVPAIVANVDSGLVERIIENLVSNAFRYTAPGTPVWVRVRATPEGTLLIVDDAGEGVPDDSKPLVFEAFHQGPTMSHSPGTGVGLSLVARFAELHGGEAWVEDREGGGASFRVRIPDLS